jgi:hypothetical protein
VIPSGVCDWVLRCCTHCLQPCSGAGLKSQPPRFSSLEGRVAAIRPLPCLLLNPETFGVFQILQGRDDIPPREPCSPNSATTIPPAAMGTAGLGCDWLREFPPVRFGVSLLAFVPFLLVGRALFVAALIAAPAIPRDAVSP